jgi:hypothetical protein
MAMSHGGKRSGAGRPKGAKNKLTESVILEAAEAGEMPLEYMLRVMWSCAETDPDRADRMAIAAAPYMHVKKKEATVSDGLVVQITPFDASVA